MKRQDPPPVTAPILEVCLSFALAHLPPRRVVGLRGDARLRDAGVLGEVPCVAACLSTHCSSTRVPLRAASAPTADPSDLQTFSSLCLLDISS